MQVRGSDPRSEGGRREGSAPRISSTPLRTTRFRLQRPDHRRGRGVGALLTASTFLLASMALASCTNATSSTASDGASASRTSPTRPELGAVEPLVKPITSTQVPGALSGTASREKVERAARTVGDDHVSAEEFALALSQSVMDVREAVDMRSLLADVGCDALSARTRSALIGEVEGQRRSGLGRYWSTDQTMWVRSQVEDRGYAVEIAGVVHITDGSYTGWNTYRVDVERSPGGWCVSEVSAQPILPKDPAVPREKADLREALVGDGWRAVRP